MDDEAFKMAVIDRLGRIETTQTTTNKTLESIDARLEKGDLRMDGFDMRLACVEQTLNHSETGLVKQVKKNTDDIQGFNLKTAALGGAAGVLSALGIGGLGWLTGIFNGK